MTNPNDIAMPSNGVKSPISQGLSKREYFAALAFQSYIGGLAVQEAATLAVRAADALIAELNK